jgi:hypothetical protein
VAASLVEASVAVSQSPTPHEVDADSTPSVTVVAQPVAAQLADAACCPLPDDALHPEIPVNPMH